MEAQLTPRAESVADVLAWPWPQAQCHHSLACNSLKRRGAMTYSLQGLRTVKPIWRKTAAP